MADHFGICQGVDMIPGCGNRVVSGSAYCQHHLCQDRGCHDPQAYPFMFCSSHKCIEADCGELRKRLVAHAPGGRFGLVYCQDHACAVRACLGKAEEEEAFCADHRVCRVGGCTRCADHTSEGQMRCREHDRRERETSRQEQSQSPQQQPGVFVIPGPWRGPAMLRPQPWDGFYI